MVKKTSSSPIVLIYVTAPSVHSAEKIGAMVVKEGFAVCANVLGPVRSVFRWQGKIERVREAVLILKTRKSRVASLTKRIKALHSYSVPCVVALPIIGGNEDFLVWVEMESKAADVKRRSGPKKKRR
jgi:periplasmic divalent cation tolerance protein